MRISRFENAEASAVGCEDALIWIRFMHMVLQTGICKRLPLGQFQFYISSAGNLLKHVYHIQTLCLKW